MSRGDPERAAPHGSEARSGFAALEWQSGVASMCRDEVLVAASAGLLDDAITRFQDALAASPNHSAGTLIGEVYLGVAEVLANQPLGIDRIHQAGVRAQKAGLVSVSSLSTLMEARMLARLRVCRGPQHNRRLRTDLAPGVSP